MRSLVLFACALAACSHSSVTGAPLKIDSVEPARVSARGGATLRVHGQGFDPGVRLFVEGQELQAIPVDAATLEATMPPATAGHAEVRVELDGEVSSLPDAIEIQAIPLAFADAPSWVVPSLPGPVEQLAASTAGLVVAGPWGVHAMAWADGKLVSAPVAALIPTGGTSMPRVLALAATAAGDRVALCADDAKVLHWLGNEDGGLVELASGGALPGACEALAIGSATPSDPAIFVRVATPDGPRVYVWHPGADPVAVTTPSLPAKLDAWLATDLDGDADDDLLIAGADANARTEAWIHGPAGFVNDGALPPRSARTYAFATLDSDHDGDLDVLAAGDGADALFLNDGHGRFVDDGWRELPFERASGHAASAADFDRDGRTDLVVGTPDGLDRLYLGTDAAFEDRTPLLGLEAGSGAMRLVVTDVDHDGDADIASVTASGALRVRLLVDAPEAAP